MNDKSTAYEIARRWAYMTRPEIDLMYGIVSNLPENARIVNIGAGAGTSGIALRVANPDAEIYTIDISPGGPLGGLESEKNMFKEFKLRLPEQILGDSKAVGTNWNRGFVHAVFIDGDHTEPGVTGDITAWDRNLVPGGYMLLHDYGSNFWPSVKDVADRLMPHLGFDFIYLADTLAVYRKPL